ncbi:MAG: DNA recombination/repair protein RecA, partial [Saprospiraceae bacterium]
VAEFDIMFGEGISKVGEIVDLGADADIIQKSGAWYSFEGTKIAQGRDAAKQFFMDNPELAWEVEQKIKAKFVNTPRNAVHAEEETMADID